MARTKETGSAQRYQYLDIIKFVFAIFIVLFHFGKGILPGGRIAVEGFFMISGFLMMRSIEKNQEDASNIGVSTFRFMAHKYGILLAYLLPSALVAYIVTAAVKDYTLGAFLKGLPLLLFEIFPVNSLGFQGRYIIGISWFLSSLMIAMAVLYPICRKYGERFILTAGIPLTLVIYGFLSKYVGDLAVPLWLDGAYIPTGMLRGVAGCLAGTCIYCLHQRIRADALTDYGRVMIFILELLGYAFLIYAAKKLPKSAYDYVLVFVLFALILIGVSGLSILTRFCSRWNTRILGTCSTLLVMNHRQFWVLFWQNNSQAGSVWLYLCVVAAACFVVFILEKNNRRVLQWIKNRYYKRPVTK